MKGNFRRVLHNSKFFLTFAETREVEQPKKQTDYGTHYQHHHSHQQHEPHRKL